MTDIDKKNIYNKLVNLLVNYCDTCTDKHQKEKILLCAFRLELIEYAESINEDSEGLWEDMAKILNVKLNSTTYINNKRCNCANGVCALC